MNELLEHLERRLQATTGLDPVHAHHVSLEVLDVFSQTVDAFIVSRHAELQRRGFDNPEIYRIVQQELGAWRFAAPSLSLRQIRRRIYG